LGQGLNELVYSSFQKIKFDFQKLFEPIVTGQGANAAHPTAAVEKPFGSPWGKD
jgi:hypothetical protein